MRIVSAISLQAERSLTNPDGLPHRSWYKHLLYAPGTYAGYGAKTMPGVREGIEQRNWPEATQQIEVIARTLEAFADQLDRGRVLMARPGT